ncbi:hypothetical protein MVEN_01710800 [Mycena venus]|uniref:Uncharacterized protein n=1 Tax=Mycena venus TaxID=2733690 RepID=A0A8H7CQW5_9AGAR|nr:hypothetical protein MVEN_01710800 [Mycena venus]
MGSYTSVMNDTSSVLYIKYAANHVALDVAAVVTAVLGVVAVVVTAGAASVAFVPALAIIELGLGGAVGGTLTLAALVTGSIDLAAKKAGYHSVAPGNSYRSSKLTLSLVHQADVQVVQQINNSTINMWSGSFTVFTGATAGSTKTYKLSQQLSKLDFKQTTFTQSTGSQALFEETDLFSNFSLVHYNDGSAKKLALQESCALSDLD